MQSTVPCSKTSKKMILLFLIISVFGVIQTHGQCDYTPIKTDVSALGTRRSYCEYQIKSGTNVATMKILPETTFRTLDCHSCTCSHRGMQCCPTNRDPRSLRVPPHCRIIMDGCTPTPVKKADNRTDCYSAQPVQVVRENRHRINRVLKTFNQINRYRKQQQVRGGEAPESPNMDEIMLMMAISGAFDNPYSPVGTAGPVGGQGPAGPDPPFMPMNDLMPFMMMGMLGS